jgi:hypothetical protein
LELDLEPGLKLDLVVEPESKPGPSFRIETRIGTGIFEKKRNLGGGGEMIWNQALTYR